ncbi:MAG: hypothetical protein ACREYE_23830 [Gammaproteobacteria bacterium]
MRCQVLQPAKLTIRVVLGIVLAGLCDVQIARAQAESQSTDQLGRGAGAQGAAVPVPCPTASSREQAEFLREESYRRYQTLSYIVGSGDARAQEALRLYYCYRAQATR